MREHHLSHLRVMCICGHITEAYSVGKCSGCNKPFTPLTEQRDGLVPTSWAARGLSDKDFPKINTNPFITHVRQDDTASIINSDLEFSPPIPENDIGPREFVYKRDNYQCLKCGSRQKLTIDHIVPRFRGGRNLWWNYQTMCSSCNGDKGLAVIDYRKPDPENSPCIQHRNFKTA